MDSIRSNYTKELEEIREKKEISKELNEKLTSFYTDLLNDYLASDKAA